MAQWWQAVLAVWIALIVVLHVTAPRWNDVTYDGELVYMPERMSSIQGEKLLEAAFPQAQSKSEIVLVLAREDAPITAADMAVADRLVETFTPAEGDRASPIVGVLSHQTPVISEKLKSPDGHAQLIVLQMRNEFMAVDNVKIVPENIYRKLEQAGFRRDPNGNFQLAAAAGLRLGVSGSMAIGADMLDASEQSVRNTEYATVVLVFLILTLVYRAPGFVLIPLVTIFLSVVAATDVAALLVQFSRQAPWFDFKIFRETRIFIVVVLFGAGTDFCLFLIARFKEEMGHGLDQIEAMSKTLGRVGDAVSASAMTTILGLSMMWFCDFGKFHFSGPAIALCLSVALLASLTLAPPLILLSYGIARLSFRRFESRAMSFLFGAAHASSEADDHPGSNEPATGRVWEWISRKIIARPGLILAGSLLAMAPLVAIGWQTNMSFDFLTELSAERASVQGTRLLQRYFPAGETGPMTILAYDPGGGLDERSALWDRIQPLADRLAAFTYVDSRGRTVHPVKSVRSLAEPLGERAGGGFSAVFKRSAMRGTRQARSTYLAQAPDYVGKVTRFDLIAEYGPFSAESIRLLKALNSFLYDQVKKEKDSRWKDAEFYFTGTTAGIHDLKGVTESDLALIKRLVPLAVLAVLIVLLRRPMVCLYLIFTVLLGYYVTMGVSELLFSQLYGATFDGLDWKVPMFVFVILVAVGQDYNVYLITRVVEEQKRRGRTEGLRVAVVRTGGIITSCGVIMAGTFASMLTGTLRAMHELGFTLAFGVLLDTFIIRTILVPSFVVLSDRFADRLAAFRARRRDRPAVLGNGYGGKGQAAPDSPRCLPHRRAQGDEDGEQVEIGQGPGEPRPGRRP